MIYLLSLLLYLHQGSALDYRFDAKDLNSIKIQNSSGNITFKSHEKPHILVQSKKVSTSQGCKIDIQPISNSLRIKNLNTEKVKMESNCKTHFTIALPSYFSVDVSNGLGDLSISGMRSQLNFRIGFGNVVVTDSELVKATGVTGKGHITANHLMKSAKFRTGKGNIKVSYLKPPQKGSLDLSTGSGDAYVQLPQNSRSKIKFQSALGSLKSHIKSDLKAPFSIHMKSGVGNLDISSSK